MADSPKPQGTPRRPSKEYEDPHFHDEDDVAPVPSEEGGPPSPIAKLPARPPRKLPPPKRRFHED